MTKSIQKIQTFTFQPVGRENWTDFEKLFECKGAPHYCWCTLWRDIKKANIQADKSGRKKFMKHFVEQGIPIGLLAYAGTEPVAWCSIAPRETYRQLGGDPAIGNVWSLVCFFIKRPYRKQGLKQQLLNQAVLYAGAEGAEYVEAYPVLENSPSYRFMGTINMFETYGFNSVKKAGSRRHVMLLRLAP